MSIPPKLMFNSIELQRAHATWGCNCGPGALAACTGLTLDEVRPALGRFGQLGYMNREMMHESVVKLDFRATADLVADQDGVDRYPEHGLCLVQFGGPWFTSQNASAKWAQKHTHWITSKIREDGQHWIFDVNCMGWVTFQHWTEATIPLLMAADKLRDGTYWLSISWEIRVAQRCNRGRR